jgi:hypothetical protein
METTRNFRGERKKTASARFVSRSRELPQAAPQTRLRRGLRSRLRCSPSGCLRN